MGLASHIRLPCNQCIGCRLARSAEWATRCIHEAKQHRYNTWLTLTYDDDHLPRKYFTGQYNLHNRKPIYSGSLDKTHTQRFIRALRKYLSSKTALTANNVLFEYQIQSADRGLRPLSLRKPRAQLRYYYGGEYGDRTRRPHYHLCLFGIEFNDKKIIETTELGFKLYTSQTLQKIWPHGQAIIGDLNWETAAYTARYIMKKITGKKQKEHYKAIDKETGEIINLTPEFNDMSTKPGIGQKMYEKFSTDIYHKKTSYVILKGKKTKPPRYYDKLHTRAAPEHMATIKRQRIIDNALRRAAHTQERLIAEEKIVTAATQSLKQKF